MVGKLNPLGNFGFAVKEYYEVLLQLVIGPESSPMLLPSEKQDMLTFHTFNIQFCTSELLSRGCTVYKRDSNAVIFQDPFNSYFRVIFSLSQEE